MSLYNMIYGKNVYCNLAMHAAGLEDKNVGRLRDAYFVMEEGEIAVCVYTRNGGGNRECYTGCDPNGDPSELCYGCVITP